MSVFVLDKKKRPLMPCSEKRARKLLESGRARVVKLVLFSIAPYTGILNIQTREGVVQGISHRYCKVLQRGDGYGYQRVAFTDAIGAPPRGMDAAHPALCLPGLNAGVSRAIPR